MLPSRGLLLVRPIDSAEHFVGGRIIIPINKRERLTANQYDVVAVGAFAECDAELDEDCERPHSVVDGLRVHAHPVRVGDWILCAPRSVLAGPDPERPECFVHQDAVLGIFNSEA